VAESRCSGAGRHTIRIVLALLELGQRPVPGKPEEGSHLAPDVNGNLSLRA